MTYNTTRERAAGNREIGHPRAGRAPDDAGRDRHAGAAEESTRQSTRTGKAASQLAGTVARRNTGGTADPRRVARDTTRAASATGSRRRRRVPRGRRGETSGGKATVAVIGGRRLSPPPPPPPRTYLRVARRVLARDTPASGDSFARRVTAAVAVPRAHP